MPLNTQIKPSHIVKTKNDKWNIKLYNATQYIQCPGYDIELHLMVRLQFLSSGEYEVSLHCDYFQVHCDL